MLHITAERADTTPVTSLDGVTITYCVDAAEARRRLGEMVAKGPVALDIETAPNRSEVDRVAELTQAKEVVTGRFKALGKLGAPADEIAAIVAEGKKLAAQIKFAEAAALDPRRSRIRLLQVYTGGDRVLVIDLDRTGAGVLAMLDGASVICHNAAFEMSFLEIAGIALGEVHCTLQATRLTLGERAVSLADAASAYLNMTLDKKPQRSDWNAPHLTLKQVQYAALDAVVAWRVAERVMPALGPQTSAYEIQMRAVPASMRMETRGFKLDVDAHARLMAGLESEHAAARDAYRDACLAYGRPDLASTPAPSTPRQKVALLETLLTPDELVRWPKTEKSDELSTRRSDLQRAGHLAPIAAVIAMSTLEKLRTSFGPTLAALVSPADGRIHAHYLIAGTSSGRASCSGPNLQQIPRAGRYRALFKPEPGSAIVVADYASMELRAAAFISGDRAMTRAFEEGHDLHRITASRMSGKPLEEVTAEERRAAKAVNFGACFGMGVGGLIATAWSSYGLRLTEAEAKRWLVAFERAYPTFAQWRRDHHDLCCERNVIVIGRDAARGIGRRFPFSRLRPGNTGYTRCCNLPIQGACADASMLALAYVDDRLFEAGIDGGPVAWLHDEIVLEVREDQAERAAEILKQAMIEAFVEIFPGAPINGLVEPHIGSSWGEAKG